ncbi:SGNH/GDSL hydrolase family protein [Cohnella herbarum]|uniref:SGNH/GDSL hydrolase family protein n=1 Tax=Cohnella herbarum TaxID=2728023 RepID=A0A7Z2VQA3_9BACL|nr:SGNH/GDSL hydrolase family protein [Cohnella herbarum]QJD87208.1 SGNH/GDSL hydrolase family protein [Cohnella herbarum]
MRMFESKILIPIFVIFVVIGAMAYYGDKLSKVKEQKNIDEDKQLLRRLSSSIEQKSNLTVYDKLRQGKAIRYLVIGDSIGQSDGASEGNQWFSLLNQSLRDKYEVVPFMNRITMGGAVVLAGWIDYIEKIPKKPEGYDIVFICYGQNDQGSLKEEEFGAIYENLVRRIKQDNPFAEIVTIVESSLQSDSYPDIIKSISVHYQLINVDTRQAYRDSGFSIDSLTIDGVHPNDQGYKLYAEQIFDSINRQYDSGKRIAPLKDSLIYVNSSFTTGQTFTEWDSLNGFFKSGGSLIGNSSGFSAESEFEGEFLGLSYITDPNGGVLNVYIDGELRKQINTRLDFVVNWKSLVVNGLTKGKHRLKVEIAPQVSSSSQGTFANIVGFISN